MNSDSDLKSDLTIYNLDDLIRIRNEYFKLKDGIDKFIKEKGLEKIFDILKKEDEKCWDVALSILGNCLTNRYAKIKVLQLNQIKSCCDILKKVEKESLKNRASRIIGNLAQCMTCCSLIHEDEDVIKTVINFLSETTNLESAITHMRTIRLLSSLEDGKSKMLKHGCLRPILKFLKHENSKVLDEALKATAFFINKFSEICVLQLVEEEAINSLIVLIKKYSKENPVRVEHCISLLYKISNLELLNPYLGNAGAICIIIDEILKHCNVDKSLFIQDFKCFKHSTLTYLNNYQLFKSLNILSISSQHVHNRNSIVNAGGLHILIESLQFSQFKLLHDKIICALTFYLYLESNILILERQNIVANLISHLLRVAELTKPLELFKLINDSLMFDYMFHDLKINYTKIKNIECEVKFVSEVDNFEISYDKLCDDEVNNVMSNSETEKGITKYSIHSPTFKSINKEFVINNDKYFNDYNVGNIFDAAPLNKDWSPYTSPPYSGSNLSSPWHSPSSVSEPYSPKSCTSYDDLRMMDTTSETDNECFDSCIYKDIEDGHSKCSSPNYMENNETTYDNSKFNYFTNIPKNYLSNNDLILLNTDSDILDTGDKNLDIFHAQFVHERKFIRKYEALDIQNSDELLIKDRKKDRKRRKELDEETCAKIKKCVDEDFNSEKKFNLEENLEQRTIIELKESSQLNKKLFALNNIILILSRMSCTNKPTLFCTKEVFLNILFCSLNNEDSCDKLLRIMKRVIGNTECLNDIIVDQILSFIYKVYCDYISCDENDLGKIEKFKKIFDALLIRFSISAASKFGQLLIHKNMKIDSMKCFYSLATCYVVRSKNIISKLQCASIKIIFSKLFEDTSFNILYSVLALSKLFQCSQLCCHFKVSELNNEDINTVSETVIVNKNSSKKMFSTNICSDHIFEERITIRGDDDLDIYCNAAFIASLSEPFAVMVGKNFVEGNLSLIQISGADYKSLELFLNADKSMSININSLDYTTLLRSYEIAHRFLAIEKESLILKYICIKMEKLMKEDSPLNIKGQYINITLAAHLIFGILRSKLNINNKIISIFEVYKHCDYKEIYSTVQDIISNTCII